MKLFDYIKSLFKPQAPPGNLNKALPGEIFPMLARSIEITDVEECGCSEVYELLDQFAELVYQGKDTSQLMPLVKQHLDMCGDCREEFEVLLNILQTQNT